MVVLKPPVNPLNLIDVFRRLRTVPMQDSEKLTSWGLDALRAFAFWAPFGQLVFGPILLNREYKQKGRSDQERRMLVGQEIVTQGINCLIHATSFLALGKLVGLAIKKIEPFSKPGFKSAADNVETLACNAGSFFGMSIIRPIVGGKVLNKWFEQEGDDKSKGAKSPAPATQSSPPAFQAASPTRLNVVSPAAAASGSASGGQTGRLTDAASKPASSYTPGSASPATPFAPSSPQTSRQQPYSSPALGVSSYQRPQPVGLSV